MPCFICRTCGTQFAATATPPAACPICEDERQYVDYAGQQWTTLDELQRDHANRIEAVEPGLTGIGTTPAFAIGQRALLVQTPEGNLLWDCLTLLDPPTVAAIHALGGVRAIAISHPHYYGTMVEWAHTFGVTISLHADDQALVMRPDPAISFWTGETHPLFGGLTLIRCGGHFAGAQVLHWQDGAGGRGALLTGDILMVVQDRRYVSFMYSYPKPILDSETPILLLEEPEIPYQPWHAPLSEWPVTMWPAFEAIKCAERQSPELAAELDWAIRRAFFAESQCISMRHVLFSLAEQVGLAMPRFAEDFDGGVAKRQVLQEAQDGWEHLKVEGSPTLVLPSGEQVSYLGLPKVTLDEQRHARLVSLEPAPCRGYACRELLREILDHAIAEAATTEFGVPSA